MISQEKYHDLILIISFDFWGFFVFFNRNRKNRFGCKHDTSVQNKIVSVDHTIVYKYMSNTAIKTLYYFDEKNIIRKWRKKIVHIF